MKRCLYKTKCAACHGADLAGEPAAKIPSLVSEDSKKASDADLTDMIANGGKDKKAMHAFGAKGVTPDQVKMIVSYIRTAQSSFCRTGKNEAVGIAVPRGEPWPSDRRCTL